MVPDESQRVILGCTEIGLLIQGADTKVKLYDTTGIHVHQAVQLALGISAMKIEGRQRSPVLCSKADLSMNYR